MIAPTFPAPLVFTGLTDDDAIVIRCGATEHTVVLATDAGRLYYDDGLDQPRASEAVLDVLADMDERRTLQDVIDRLVRERDEATWGPAPRGWIGVGMGVR